MTFQHYKIKINAFSVKIFFCVCLSSSITILFCISIQPPFCYSLDILHSPEERKEESLKIFNRSLFFFQELSTDTAFYFKLLVNIPNLIRTIPIAKRNGGFCFIAVVPSLFFFLLSFHHLAYLI